VELFPVREEGGKKEETTEIGTTEKANEGDKIKRADECGISSNKSRKRKKTGDHKSGSETAIKRKSPRKEEE
jgi:hypothetical protein